jgi:hypothetical protein
LAAFARYKAYVLATVGQSLIAQETERWQRESPDIYRTRRVNWAIAFIKYRLDYDDVLI